MTRGLLAVLAFVLCPCAGAQNVDYSAVLRKIADDIAALKPEYAQLADFSTAKNFRADALTITYQYRTHRPTGGAGWTGGVPNPDPDGVWFYIDVHEPGSTAQIHTQPAILSPACLGEKRLTFLSLEGTDTKRLDSAIRSILGKHGVQPCARARAETKS